MFKTYSLLVAIIVDGAIIRVEVHWVRLCTPPDGKCFVPCPPDFGLLDALPSGRLVHYVGMATCKLNRRPIQQELNARVPPSFYIHKIKRLYYV